MPPTVASPLTGAWRGLRGRIQETETDSVLSHLTTFTTVFYLVLRVRLFCALLINTQ